MSQRVFELHQLNKYVVFWIQSWRSLWTLEVERQPFLDAFHARALRQIEEQREVKHDRRRKNRVTTEKVDLDLHRVAEPAEDVDVIPTFFVVAARRIVV